ncbi:hypothetical protein MYSTI_03059 [Myxococcus stipitatus DSM 14675]|uniref:DUF7481 domain-containing protein n=1 Tax=Myxococcus stipitatus (strain DSM 14675 / JCM 12634 / Mx s8) TaxID=1278073 RepID=L7U939_MYXSD|nr:hypothetical protein [Myxococcus stipitatus]AGC44375.1 hypothetical protein MYSTI_03059 [Myxococcus stipitatus DSM 14675]
MRCRDTSVLLAVLVVMGCSPSKDEVDDGPGQPGQESPDDFYKSGSRLKAQVTTTADGLRWPTEGFLWFDTTLNQPCYWEESGGGGAVSCIPREMNSIPPGKGGFYADAGCTEGLILRSELLPPGTHFARKGAACGEYPRYHAMGELVSRTTAYFHDGTTCSEVPVSPASKVYRVGAGVTAGTFARGTLKERTKDSGISAHFIDGEDGSAQFVHLRDVARDTACGNHWASDGKRRCLPVGPTTAHGQLAFAAVNPTCTEAAYSATCVARPRFAVTLSQSSCAPASTVHEAGVEVTQVYSAAGAGVCQPLTMVPPDTRFFQAGAPIPASSFVELKEVDLKTHGRLKVRGMAAGDAVRIPVGVHDTELDTDCRFLEDASRKLRCFPLSNLSSNQNLFADSACTSPVGVEDVPTCASSPPSKHVLVRTFTATTPYYRAYNTGAKHDGPLFERPFGGGTPGDCRPAQRTSGAAYYQLGVEIPATSLVEGTRTRD